jgi:hypothetical protein
MPSADAEPPHRIVRAEMVVEIAAQPDAEERADLVRQEHDAAQQAKVARAEHDRDQAVGRRHRGEPQEAHDDGEDDDGWSAFAAGAGRRVTATDRAR